MVVAAPEEVRLSLNLRGGNREIFAARDAEVISEGPAGTGKTRTWLELMHQLCTVYDGLRVLMLREIQATMATSCIAELQKRVLHPGDGVTFFGGSKSEPAAFRYPNGSMIAVSGMDNAEKVLSSFWDFIYFNEATQTTLEKWETLTTRLRAPEAGHEPRHRDTGQPFRYRRIGGDCNPTFEHHWLHKRCNAGMARLIRSRLEDNPAYYDDDGVPTEAGAAYIATLDKLTGTRYQRFRLGLRVGMENAIYPQLDFAKDVAALPSPVVWGAGAIGVDYGRVHLSAVVAIQRDSTGILWVRECWAENGGDPQKIEDASRSMKVRFKITRGRTDPVQEVLANRLNFSVAKIAAGSRKARISYVTRLLDAGALKFDAAGLGVMELYEEMQAYRYEIRETTTDIDDVVVRKDDDRVAALEYAVEETETGEGHGAGVVRVPMSTGRKPTRIGGLWNHGK